MKRNRALLISYLAGYFDGLGSICVETKQKEQYELFLEVNSHLNKKPLNLMFSIFGGLVHICWSPENKKCFYCWRLKDVYKIKKVLKLMLPFLRIKHSQAEYAIRLAERIIVGNKKKKKNKFYLLTDFEKNKRQMLVNKIRELESQLPDELKLAETKRKDNTI